jgi:hypothetical protein
MSDDQTTVISDDLMLVNWLKDRDAACPLCGYNIRGLISPRCPECGQALRLSVSLAEPYLKAWIALIAALLPTAGVGAIVIFGFFYSIVEEGVSISMMFGGMRLGEGFLILFVVGCVPLSIAAVIFRRRFLRFSREMQGGLASTAWIAVVISIILALAEMH